VVQFFRISEFRALVAYATLFLVSILATSVLKLLLCMVMIKNSVNREIKRLEFQVVKLREKLKASNTMT
jgi:low affinity Fe/Cu permease